jgi:DNA-binding transcriptional LysR family regulator
MQQNRNDTGELNFYLLKCLVALVDHSHVSRAAESLSISQPAMSRAMSQLRLVTADPILVKGGGRLIPTAKAIQLREFADRILREMSDLLGSAMAFDPLIARHDFRMICTDYAECLVMGRIARHLGNFPNVSLTVSHPVHPAEFNKVLEAGEIDFAIGNLPSSLRDLRHRLLLRDRIVCIARAGHPAAGRDLTPQEFADLQHVVIVPNTITRFGEVVDKALEAHGLQRNRRFRTPNYLTPPYLVQKTDMVAVLPDSLAAQFREHLALVDLRLPFQLPDFEIYLSWHDRTHRHAAHMWFREQVMHSLALHGRA